MATRGPSQADLLVLLFLLPGVAALLVGIFGAREERRAAPEPWVEHELTSEQLVSRRELLRSVCEAGLANLLAAPATKHDALLKLANRSRVERDPAQFVAHCRDYEGWDVFEFDRTKFGEGRQYSFHDGDARGNFGQLELIVVKGEIILVGWIADGFWGWQPNKDATE